MKFKGFWYDGLLISLSAGIAAFFIVLIAFVNPKLAISAVIAYLIICVFAVYRALSAKGRYKRFLIKTTKKQVQAFGSHLSDGLCVFLVFVLIVV
jgi:hypothetical protein